LDTGVLVFLVVAVPAKKLQLAELQEVAPSTKPPTDHRPRPFVANGTGNQIAAAM